MVHLSCPITIIIIIIILLLLTILLFLLYYFMVEYNTKSICCYNFQKYLFTLLHYHLFIYTLHALYTH